MSWTPTQDEPQDSIFQMTEADLDEFREDNSGMLHINDIFLSQGLEPPIVFQPQDSTFQMTEAELHEFRENISGMPPPETHRVDSSGRIQDEPATVQPQDSIFQMTEAELDEFHEHSSGRLHINHTFLSQELEPSTVFQPQDVPPPEEPQTLPRPSIRPLSRAERDEFIDSSGRLDFRAIFLAQGLGPPIFLQELEDRNLHRIPPPVQTETLPRPLSLEELAEFTNSSGRLDYRAIFLAQGLEPPIILQQIEDRNRTPPSETPLGLSEETISKFLKTMNADQFRAHNKDGDRKICAVCLDDVCGQKDIVAILDNCGHEFHYCCLKTWLRRKNICPLCRRTAIFLLGDDR